MPSDAFLSLVGALRQLSTEIVFLLILGEFLVYALAVLFSVDLMAILLTVFVRRYAEHHLALRPMADALGVDAPYRRTDRNAVFAVFLRGMAASGIRPAPAPPRPPGP